MEEMMKPPPTRPATLTMREDSHSISKPKPAPQIRIIHLFAPEIIKTDAANFRELVQRLTGKPTKRPPIRSSTCKKMMKKKKVMMMSPLANKGEYASLMEQGVKDEKGNNMWGVEDNYWNNSGGYLCELGDVEGYFQGFGDLSMLPLMTSSSSSTTSTSSHMDHMIGEGQVI